MIINYILIGFKNDKDVKNLDALSDDLKVPKMTLGFNLGFRNVFSFISHIECNQPVGISSEFYVSDYYYFRSDDDKLDGIEGRDHIFILKIHASNNKILEELPLVSGDKNKLNYILENINIDNELKSKISDLKTPYPSVKLWNKSLPSENLEEPFLNCFAFYYYGWLILTRLERKIGMVSLLEKNTLKDSWIEELKVNRRILINVSRYFLTSNRTVNNEMKKICRDITSTFSSNTGFFELHKRYQRLDKLQLDIESYVDIVGNIESGKRAKTLETSVKILTVLGVPLAILGILFDFNLESDAISNPVDSLINGRMGIAIAMSIVLPLLVWLSLFILVKIFDFGKKALK